MKQVSEMEEMVEKLTRERNHFAQKLVAAQSNKDQGSPMQVQRTPEEQTNIITTKPSTQEERNARLNPFFIEERPQTPQKPQQAP